MRFVVCTLLLATAVHADEASAIWTQWRGPNRDGILRNAKAWPTKLKGDSLQELWRVEKIGPSYSGTLVTEDRVFTTATLDQKEEVAQCLDRKSGKVIWTQKWPGGMTVPFFAARNGSWIRSTPAYDGESLYVAGMKDLLVCLDAKDGKERWRLDFPKEVGSKNPDFGFVCSPLVDEKAVYVQAGGGFSKLDKKTGKILWTSLKDGGGTFGSAFSSPVFANLAGKEQIVVQTRSKLAGVDRDTGAELWSKEIPSFRGMNILTPQTYGDAIFTSTYGGNTRLITLRSEGGKLATDDTWSFKYEGHMTSPVVIKDHAYLLGKDRRFVCVELKTGKEAWRTEERFSDYFNMVANGDQILALDSTGKLLLIQADPKEFRLLDSREVAKSETWAHLAIVGDELFIRDLSGLTAYRWK
jgi:outer membrane protein assembly factor BamB